MKRGLAPLLGIAFVVALAASGIFYGVFANQLKKVAERPVPQQLAVAARSLERGTVLREGDLRLSAWPGTAPPGTYREVRKAVGKTIYVPLLENEPLSEVQLSTAKASTGFGIAKGMRALSVRVVDSSGLMPLRPGDRVDVQAIQNRGNSQATLRTILQNVEVLSAQAQPEGNPNLIAASVVTLLVSSDNQDPVALADSGANIRLVLRNPTDLEEVRRPSLMLASIFSERQQTVHTPGMELLVQVARASEQGLLEIASVTGIAAPHTTPWFALVSRRPNIEVFLSKRVTLNDRQPSTVDVANGFSIHLKSWAGPDRSVRLQVQPELTISHGATASMRSFTAGLTLADGQSALMTGLSDTLGEPAQPSLVVMITAHLRH